MSSKLVDTLVDYLDSPVPVESRKDHIFSVTELTQSIKNLLETQFPPLWLEAEISNFRKPSSGHFYFTLKDERAQIQGIMYRSSASKVPFKIEDGMKLLVFGSISVYERSGQYQIIVQTMEPKGVGALQLAFEQLKKKLSEEGLFDSIHKKPIPLLPKKVGVVTSPTGAALRDILNILNRRFSNIHLIINPVRVQGEQSPMEIAAAIDEFNRLKLVDVILVTRGGGSLEDLWGFNDEHVARSIFASKIPVISAVGHEIDWTISDYVADLRVPTPSAAAELVISSKADLIEKLENYIYILNLKIKQKLSNARHHLTALSQHKVFAEPENRIKQLQQHIDDIEFRIHNHMKHLVELIQSKLLLYTEKLTAFSPSAILARGYSIVTKLGDAQVVKSVKSINPGSRLKIYLADGDITATADRIIVKDNTIIQ